MSEGTDIQIPCDGKMINFEEDEEDQHRYMKREADKRSSVGASRPNTCERRRGGGSPAIQGGQFTNRRPQIPEIGTANNAFATSGQFGDIRRQRRASARQHKPKDKVFSTPD